MGKKSKRSNSALVKNIILVICLIVFVGSAGMIIDYVIDGIKEQSALEKLSSMKSSREESVATDNGTVDAKYADLYLENDDLIGWVQIEDTKIDYPVMQTRQDPEYYLHRAFDGSDASSGTPFMDAASDIFLPTSNFLIYGHNMRNGTMFHDLLKYEEREFFEMHRSFTFDTVYEGGQGIYKVVAAGYSQILPEKSTKFKYYRYADITSEKKFDEYMEGVKSLSLYDTGVTAEYGDQLVTLSTCAYHTDNGRFFVVGVRDTKR